VIATVQIKCGSHGFHTALIDSVDIARVQQHKWYAVHHPWSRTTYARTYHTIYLHQLILELYNSEEIDHADNNGLNCQRSNLRHTTRNNNAHNWKRPNRVGYRGVAKTKVGRYVARIQMEGGRTHIGTYDTPEDAAHAYDTYARTLYGEFAVVNFP
jgi:hypothetical protein